MLFLPSKPFKHSLCKHFYAHKIVEEAHLLFHGVGLLQMFTSPISFPFKKAFHEQQTSWSIHGEFWALKSTRLKVAIIEKDWTDVGLRRTAVQYCNPRQPHIWQVWNIFPPFFMLLSMQYCFRLHRM